MKEIVCPCHLYIGQEAVAVGVCQALQKGDYVFSTHRSHGHYIAKGGDLNSFMAELYGKQTGCSRGRGGSMHICSPEIGLLGSSAIVAGTIPLAVGAALGFSLQGKDNVSVAFFGDGAVDEGVFYESLNFAALRKLPVIFVCENNLYSTHMPISDCLANTCIYKKAEAFNMPGIQIDGNNVIEIYKTVKIFVNQARMGKGQALIECLTYRWRGHVGPNLDLDKGLRSREELDYWKDRCPIKSLEFFLLENNFMSESDRRQVRKDLIRQIEGAVAFARNSSFPKQSELLDVFKRKEHERD
jgi:pyruvate dehydrogenase E1 component alpha subunit